MWNESVTWVVLLVSMLSVAFVFSEIWRSKHRP